MKILEPSFEIEQIDGITACQWIEKAARVCYKSEGRITAESYRPFLKKLLDSEHESTLEHVGVTVRFVCDRGVSHELVRHRVASFSQESTRYCNYSKDQFGSEITVIQPVDLTSDQEEIWLSAMRLAEHSYFSLLDAGASPQMARSVLPNSLKTEIVMTANFREWRHVFKLRTGRKAHPQMRQLMVPLLREFQKMVPIVFDDVEVEEVDDRPEKERCPT